jgi:hypothetical protein
LQPAIIYTFPAQIVSLSYSHGKLCGDLDSGFRYIAGGRPETTWACFKAAEHYAVKEGNIRH